MKSKNFVIYAKKKKIGFDENEKKVRDHCHYTGKFRGPAHNICNLRYKIPNKKIPVIFHNRSTYDDHFIINQLHRRKYGKIYYFFCTNKERIR